MKKIGIDTSPLQGSHRMRGIGYVTQHIINNVPIDTRNKVSFVLYVSDHADLSPKDMLKSLDLKGISYELRSIRRKSRSNLPGRLAIISKVSRKLLELHRYRRGTPEFGNTNDLDVFIQFDQNQPFPQLRRSTKKILIGYDMIPYILKVDYLWNYKSARRHGLSRKASIKRQVQRVLYKRKLLANTKNCDLVLAISKTTKRDFIRELRIKKEKIKLINLGIPPVKDRQPSPSEYTLQRYKDTSWGYIPRPYTLASSEPYLLFVGGADSRRKLEDLIAAFNQLRARSYKLKLVLAGDSMQGPKNISNPAIQRALTHSAYNDDIVYAGFTDDTTRDWLYMHAAAFVFPSIYEGFGLPVLEAMSYQTPVISYENAAALEVAQDGPVYVSNVQSLMNAIISILKNSDSKRNAENRARQANLVIKKYSWKNTGKELFSIILNS